MCYTITQTSDWTADGIPFVTNNNYGGLPVAKNTNLRTGLYDKVVTGLHCGINLRMMRYSDVLLRAAECENEVNGPTQQAIDWINIVRRRAGLKDLQLANFNTADKLFEQIANVERPKEFGCEFGRGFDLLRWGFFYDAGRLQQMKELLITMDAARVPSIPLLMVTSSSPFIRVRSTTTPTSWVTLPTTIPAMLSTSLARVGLYILLSISK